MDTSILTNKGKRQLLESIRASELYLAWGIGSPSWSSSQSIVVSFHPVDNTISVGYTPIGNVAVKSSNGAVTYTVGTDYSVNFNTGVVTRIAGGAIEGSATVQVTFRVEPPAENPNATALVGELGRRKVLDKQWVLPDEAGDVWTHDGRFSVSTTPTNYLMCKASFEPDEAPTATIREYGLFGGTEVVAGLPPGQRYFPVAQVTNNGFPYAVRHVPAVTRNLGTRETFYFVISL